MWSTDQGAKNLTKATPSLTAGAKVSLPRFATAVALAGSGTWGREGEEGGSERGRGVEEERERGKGKGKEARYATENWTTGRLAPDLAILGGGLARLALGGRHELLELGEGARALVRLHLGARPGGGRQGGEGEGEVGWREGVRGEEGIPEVGECGVSLHLVLLAHRLGAGGEGEAGEVRRQGGKAGEVKRQGGRGEGPTWCWVQSTLATFTCSSFSKALASSSQAGASFWQWPHLVQVQVKEQMEQSSAGAGCPPCTFLVVLCGGRRPGSVPGLLPAGWTRRNAKPPQCTQGNSLCVACKEVLGFLC